MKRLFLLVTILAGSFIVKAQDYELIYANSNHEVQSKLNENKMNGVNILNGVSAEHRMGLVGLSQANAKELTSLLSNNSEIISFKLNDDLSDLLIESDATLSLQDLKMIIATSNSTITGYSVTYSINP